MDGAVAKSVVPAARWDIDRFHSPRLRPGTMNTRYAHFIDDADQFDHEFFGISPVEAAALDPQQRLVLQSVWRALEDAAIDPRALAGTDAGVFVGMMLSEWGAAQSAGLSRRLRRSAGSGPDTRWSRTGCPTTSTSSGRASPWTPLARHL